MYVKNSSIALIQYYFCIVVQLSDTELFAVINVNKKSERKMNSILSVGNRSIDHLSGLSADILDEGHVFCISRVDLTINGVSVSW